MHGVPCLELDISNLQTLMLESCRDIAEVEFLHALLNMHKVKQGLTSSTRSIYIKKIKFYIYADGVKTI